MEKKNIHTVWHAFCDYMKKWYYEKYFGYKKDFTLSKKQYKVFKSEKMVGYQAACKIAKYAKDKDDILITGCDDSYHMGSDIVLITHEDDDKFMGTTMILVPQCKTDINEVFLYPHHLDGLIEKLTEIQKRATKKREA